MATDRLDHNWTEYKPGWLHIPGKPVCFIRTEPLADGYLWQHGKQVGFCGTFDEAKELAETAREIWPRLLR